MKDKGNNIDKNSIKKYIINNLKPSSRKQLTQKAIEDAINEAIKTCMNPMSVGAIFAFKTFDVLCEKCGECCKLSDPILISEVEIPAYSQYFGKHFDSYIISKEGKWYFKNTKPCIFLSSIGTCNIYDLRPIVCRGYPFNKLEKIEVNSKCKIPTNMAKRQALSILVGKLMDKEHPEFKKEIKNMFKIDEKLLKNMTPEQQLACGVAISKIIKSSLGSKGEII